MRREGWIQSSTWSRLLFPANQLQDVLFFLVFLFASLCWKDQRQNNFLGLFWTIWGLKLFFLPVLCINQFGDVSKGGKRKCNLTSYKSCSKNATMAALTSSAFSPPTGLCYLPPRQCWFPEVLPESICSRRTGHSCRRFQGFQPAG